MAKEGAGKADWSTELSVSWGHPVLVAEGDMDGAGGLSWSATGVEFLFLTFIF